MIDEEIKKLLDSNVEDDNMIGWELVKAKKVSYEDVVEYVENAKIPIQWSNKYVWDGTKFSKNPYIDTMTSGSVLTVNSSGTGISWPGWYGTTTTGSGTTTYTSISPLKWRISNNWDTSDWKDQYKAHRNAEIQKEKELDKPRGIWANIKNAFK